MEIVDLLITNASQVCVIPGTDGPQRGDRLGDLGLIANGAIAVADGKIVAVGDTAVLTAHYYAPQVINAHGRAVIPGFVDPHTHIPWLGDRAAEFEQRIAGASYMEIMAAGGGIMSTVRATRQASVADLVADNLPRLARMLQYGTTSAETKTGYGLETAAELRQLDAIAALHNAQPIELTPTFLPAHAIPAEYHGRTEAYVQLVIKEMLPAGATWAKEHHTSLFCDVFCEQGVFDVEQTRRILIAAAALGYRLKIHADEFVGLGGTKLAVELGAISADHLVKTPAEDIVALGLGDTIAVGLPGTPFGLAEADYTPAKAILQAGGALALATDCNPGTAWCESMQMVIALACRTMKLTQAQALAAATLNAAHAIGRGHEVGSLEPGKQADLLILDTADYRQLGYRFGTNLVQMVMKNGKVVIGER
ncbi:MAG: imidazolonepropionase [Chloroflexi bacterium]|nr:imidazolonepropionase [Ardenticatenaceae bacterium]MBL1130003.1 imidazolonepropionase [Chloroflexota bacterium]NOG36089.1 imidazolonepropionase [Chloroflexota bacterium]GIK59007.1 MAG: imidazolonepropionase [Chloroflexota bacterium]